MRAQGWPWATHPPLAPRSSPLSLSARPRPSTAWRAGTFTESLASMQMRITKDAFINVDDDEGLLKVRRGPCLVRSSRTLSSAVDSTHPARVRLLLHLLARLSLSPCLCVSGGHGGVAGQGDGGGVQEAGVAVPPRQVRRGRGPDQPAGLAPAHRLPGQPVSRPPCPAPSGSTDTVPLAIPAPPPAALFRTPTATVSCTSSRRTAASASPSSSSR